MLFRLSIYLHYNQDHIAHAQGKVRAEMPAFLLSAFKVCTRFSNPDLGRLISLHPDPKYVISLFNIVALEISSPITYLYIDIHFQILTQSTAYLYTASATVSDQRDKSRQCFYEL